MLKLLLSEYRVKILDKFALKKNEALGKRWGIKGTFCGSGKGPANTEHPELEETCEGH